jgi:hypothetical protein
MVDYLDSVSLQQLVDEQRERMARKGVSVGTLHDTRSLRDRTGGSPAKPVAALSS